LTVDGPSGKDGCIGCGAPIAICEGKRRRLFCPTCKKMRMYLRAAGREIDRLDFGAASSDQRQQLRRWLFELVNKIPPEVHRDEAGRFAEPPSA
jgi:hypothetical protein